MQRGPTGAALRGPNPLALDRLRPVRTLNGPLLIPQFLTALYQSRILRIIQIALPTLSESFYFYF